MVSLFNLLKNSPLVKVLSFLGGLIAVYSFMHLERGTGPGQGMNSPYLFGIMGGVALIILPYVLFQSILEHIVKELDSIGNKGNEHLGKQEYNQAIAIFSKGIELNDKIKGPTSIIAIFYYSRAYAYANTNQKDLAARDYQQFIQLAEGVDTLRAQFLEAQAFVGDIEGP